jgi:hypothetical protein
MIAISLLAVLFAAISKGRNNASTTQTSGPHIEPPFREMARALPPLAPLCFMRTSEQAAAITAILNRPPQAPFDGRLAIHLLRVYRNAPIPRADVSSATNLVASLTGYPAAELPLMGTPLVLTRDGARYRPSRAGDRAMNVRENHRDIFLATFAECGLPLSTPLRIGESTTSELSALLRDAVANFDLKQDEIEWSTIAFTIYMSDRKNWRDRDGKICAFDDLAYALIHRELSKSSCGGAHVLLAMTYLLRVNDEAHILSANVAESLRTHVAAAVQALVRAQLPDGSWSNHWGIEPAENTATGSSSLDRLLATGHLLEWLEYVPVHMQPDVTVYVRAGTWLIQHLQQLKRSPTFNSPAWTCPWAHAVCAVRNLAQPL